MPPFACSFNPMRALRAAAILATLLLSILAVLFVFDLVPQDALKTQVTRILLLCGVVAAVGLVLSALLKNNSD